MSPTWKSTPLVPNATILQYINSQENEYFIFSICRIASCDIKIFSTILSTQENTWLKVFRTTQVRQAKFPRVQTNFARHSHQVIRTNLKLCMQQIVQVFKCTNQKSINLSSTAEPNMTETHGTTPDSSVQTVETSQTVEPSPVVWFKVVLPLGSMVSLVFAAIVILVATILHALLLIPYSSMYLVYFVPHLMIAVVVGVCVFLPSMLSCEVYHLVIFSVFAAFLPFATYGIIVLLGVGYGSAKHYNSVPMAQVSTLSQISTIASQGTTFFQLPNTTTLYPAYYGYAVIPKDSNSKDISSTYVFVSVLATARFSINTDTVLVVATADRVVYPTTTINVDFVTKAYPATSTYAEYGTCKFFEIIITIVKESPLLTKAIAELKTRNPSLGISSLVQIVELRETDPKGVAASYTILIVFGWIMLAIVGLSGVLVFVINAAYLCCRSRF